MIAKKKKKVVATAKKNIETKQDSEIECDLSFYFIVFLSALGCKTSGENDGLFLLLFFSSKAGAPNHGNAIG